MSQQLTSKDVLENAITYLCFKAKTLSHVKLVKLIYLADMYHRERFGSRLTDVPFKHWHYGPWAQEVDSAIERLCGMGVIKQQPYVTRQGHKAEIPRPNVGQTTVELSSSAQAVLEDVIEDWGDAGSEEVISFVKSSLPFVGTSFGDDIDFDRTDPVEVLAREQGISLEEAATTLVENNAELMASLRRAREGTPS